MRRDGKSRESSVIDPIQDLRQRLSAATLIESPQAREKALAEVAWNAIEIHPETAHEAYGRLPADGPEKLRLLRHYAMRAAAVNPDTAMKWAAELGSETEINTATSHIALEVASTNPTLAANLLFQSSLEGRDFDVAVVQVVQRWAANSPIDAVAWVEQFAAGDVRQASLHAVLERWLVQDRRTAIQWAEEIDEPVLFNETCSAISMVLSQQPESTRKLWLEQDATGFLHHILKNLKDAR